MEKYFEYILIVRLLKFLTIDNFFTQWINQIVNYKINQNSFNFLLKEEDKTASVIDAQ